MYGYIQIAYFTSQSLHWQENNRSIGKLKLYCVLITETYIPTLFLQSVCEQKPGYGED